MKRCSKCKTSKKRSEFSKDKYRGDGLHQNCKICHREKSMDWRDKNPDYVKGFQMQEKYGITLEDYKIMYSEQNGRCKICSDSHKVLAVDHCHETGKVRGLLCRGCNLGLGQFRDNPESLRSAAKYLSAL